MAIDSAPAGRATTRTRIIEVAAELLADGGRAAVTTRAVADRAGVQAPTIYRLFVDKDGLLDAVAEHVLTRFTAEKRAAADADPADGAHLADPVEALRAGWSMTIEFGLRNPDLYVLISDPTRGPESPAAQVGGQLLADRIHRVARAGRLRVSEERAFALIRAAGTGAVLTTLARPPHERDASTADALFDAVLAAILDPTDPGEPDHTRAAAVALRARAGDLDVLNAAETGLLVDWLDRVISAER